MSGTGGVNGAGLRLGLVFGCGFGGASVLVAPAGWLDETVTEETVRDETVTDDVDEEGASCCGGVGGSDTRRNPDPGRGLRGPPAPAFDCWRLADAP